MANKPTKTPVRNTAIPQARPSVRPSVQSQNQGKQVTREQIAKRAYEIWKSGKGGSEQENWIRAERELRGS